LLWFLVYAGAWGIGQDVFELAGLGGGPIDSSSRLLGKLFFATFMATADLWRARRRGE